MKIMAVDDLKQNRYLLRKLLEGHGYSVETAENGVEALRKARENPPDMIIADVLMPKMDGFQLCRNLKNDEKLKNIPVLFYSATYADKKSQELAMSIGAVGYIIKPIEPDDFIKIIKEIFEKYGKGELKPVENLLEEPVYMKLYNERLIQKLEKKMLDLEREIGERKAAEERIEHLNSVLAAIRNVNQLIIKGNDRDTLLQKACDALVEARGYDAAWLGFSGDGETFAMVKGSGFLEEVSYFCEHIISGDHPPGIRDALARKDHFVVMGKSRECGDCFFESACAGKEAAIIRVEHAGRFFGLLVILFATNVAIDDEENRLLTGVASDIALGLYGMELEEVRKKAEDQINASLKEKEALIREIHHRVKNNLQVISSLIDMQARATEDKDVKDALSETRDRILTMSIIHSQLYEGSDLAEINMKEFVDRLLGQLRSYHVEDTIITHVIRVDDCPFPISVAVPVGLIINELLSNALKHAFKGRGAGNIEVSITASGDGRANLTVSDDGVGLPPGFDIDESKTLGLRLVKILTENQLQGNLEVIRDGGATFKMVFDIECDDRGVSYDERVGTGC